MVKRRQQSHFRPMELREPLIPAAAKPSTPNQSLRFCQQHRRTWVSIHDRARVGARVDNERASPSEVIVDSQV